MLLRRIRQHVAANDWFAVAVDFLVVVLGILVAIELEAWSEQRRDRVLEREYLERLYDDAARTVETNEAQRRFLLAHGERAGLVLDSLERCRVDASTADDFATGLYHLGKLYPPYMADGTWRELRSTGNLTIIRSIDLRGEMERAAGVFTEFDRVWSQVVARVAPHVNYVDSRVSFAVHRPTRGNTSMTADRLTMDFETLCSDARFRNAVAAVRSYTFDVVTWLEATRDAFETLRRALESEIRR